MHSYLLSISKTYDSNNEESYYVFDSYGVCIGYTSSLELAYSLIVNYIESLISTYKDSIYLSKCDYVNIKEKANNERDEYKCVIDIITSLSKTLKKTKEKKEKDRPKSTLEFKFKMKNRIISDYIFSENEIIAIHKKIALEHIKNIKVKNKSDEVDLYEFINKNELATHFTELKEYTKGSYGNFNTKNTYNINTKHN
ncbi:hypothetical protein H5A35_20875 [Pectobacterium brasiliense]|uniref:hypothetical protein n=1 Tax=Pectobacterium brasiliense TaxID=180957 RepID=UPI001968D61E|nr:hypothetical protein [Pectobacterium brasiliense]MBN3209853.1 hypothetical protein [Pectobacterium brasiliense]